MTRKPRLPQAGPLTVGGGPLTIEDIHAVAALGRPVALSGDPSFRALIERGGAYLDRLVREGREIYGVTTGYGDSCTTPVPGHLVAELPLHLTRFHGCGTGEVLDESATLAVLAARLNSLARGYSGVRWELLERLADLINRRILPRIPSEGSVGASGDLTPLSYVAAALFGEREVSHRGARKPALQALEEEGLAPFVLAPKEGLALMNGTAVMTGLACLAWMRADYLSRLASRLTALGVVALRGNKGHFDPRLFRVKAHAGQNESAAWIHADLSGKADGEPHRLQDRYSLRCAPHVIGVLRDALTWIRRDVENELNSANDNPIVDADAELILHGGHFYGGHIAFAMDALKTAVANVSDLMDRQFALLVDPKFSHGLPQNLSGASGDRKSVNHGYKAVQIAASAWTAEALKLTLPASVFSRSTECHNQDKVSMGTIAARDAMRVLTLTEQTAAALLLALRQALSIRTRKNPSRMRAFSPEATKFAAAIADAFPFVEEDTPLEEPLMKAVRSIQGREWTLYGGDK